MRGKLAVALPAELDGELRRITTGLAALLECPAFKSAGGTSLERQSPLNASVAEPVMNTWLFDSRHSRFKSPPGKWARSLRSLRPVRTPATQTALAPVPQASVIPLPRSQVRIVGDFFGRMHLHEVNVYSTWKRRGMLELRTNDL